MVSVVIVTFNDLTSLKRCLESVRTSTSVRYEVLVVDNASEDGTSAFLRKKGDIRFLQNERNLGWAGAVNRALGEARGEYVLLLNNDAFLLPHTVERLLECFQLHPRTGLVAPFTNVAVKGQRFMEAILSHTDTRYFKRRLQYVLGPQGSLLKDFGAYRSRRELSRFYVRFFLSKKPRFRKVPCVIGFCVLGRRQTFQEVGPLDERFRYCGFEDFDYCVRARLAGFSIRVAEHAYVHHEGSRCFTRHSRLLGGVIEENRQRFIEKWRRVPEARHMADEMIRCYES